MYYRDRFRLQIRDLFPILLLTDRKFRFQPRKAIPHTPHYRLLGRFRPNIARLWFGLRRKRYQLEWRNTLQTRPTPTRDMRHRYTSGQLDFVTLRNQREDFRTAGQRYS